MRIMSNKDELLQLDLFKSEDLNKIKKVLFTLYFGMPSLHRLIKLNLLFKILFLKPVKPLESEIAIEDNVFIEKYDFVKPFELSGFKVKFIFNIDEAIQFCHNNIQEVSVMVDDVYANVIYDSTASDDCRCYNEPVIIADCFGSLILIDGNHRLAAKVKNHESTMKAYNLSYEQVSKAIIYKTYREVFQLLNATVY